MERLVIKWADERGVLEHVTPINQYIKCLEELMEYYEEVKKGDIQAAKMEMGDVIVSTIILKEMMDSDSDYEYFMNKINDELSLQNFSFDECLKLAYDKISTRSGKMINGKFIKEADLKKRGLI